MERKVHYLFHHCTICFLLAMMNQGVFQGQYTHSYTDTNNFLSIKVKGYGLNFHLHFDEHMEVTEDVPLPKFIKSMLQVPVVEKKD